GRHGRPEVADEPREEVVEALRRAVGRGGGRAGGRVGGRRGGHGGSRRGSLEWCSQASAVEVGRGLAAPWPNVAAPVSAAVRGGSPAPPRRVGCPARPGAGRA